MITVIGDVGSTHGGELSIAKDAIEIAKEAGVDIIKFQLFKGTKNGNIELPREDWQEIVDFARRCNIDIFASVFDEDAIDLLKKSGIKKAKLAYSQNFNLKLIKKLKEEEMEIWASGDKMNYPYYADKRFFCIPEYPVKTLVNVEPDFNIMFNGFSSHLIGSTSDLKLLDVMRWNYLEKHFHTNHKVDCPDYWFGLSPKELKQCVKEIKSLR